MVCQIKYQELFRAACSMGLEGLVSKRRDRAYAADQLRLENFDPLLPEFILGRAPDRATHLIGNWGEEGMAVRPGVIHQIGHAFREFGDKVMIAVRIRLFAALENTPIYWISVGFLNKPIDEVLAPLGLRSVVQGC